MVEVVKIDAEAGWYAGTEMDFKFTLTGIDLTDRSLLWNLRTDVKNTNVVTKTTPDDISVTDAVGGLCTVSIVAEDTIELEEGWYNFALMTSDEPRVVLTDGQIYLNRAATP